MGFGRRLATAGESEHDSRGAPTAPRERHEPHASRDRLRPVRLGGALPSNPQRQAASALDRPGGRTADGQAVLATLPASLRFQLQADPGSREPQIRVGQRSIEGLEALQGQVAAVAAVAIEGGTLHGLRSWPRRLLAKRTRGLNDRRHRRRAAAVGNVSVGLRSPNASAPQPRTQAQVHTGCPGQSQERRHQQQDQGACVPHDPVVPDGPAGVKSTPPRPSQGACRAPGDHP